MTDSPNNPGSRHYVVSRWFDSRLDSPTFVQPLTFYDQAVSHQYIWLDVRANNIIIVRIGHLWSILLDLRITQSFCFESSGFESKEIFRGAIYKQRVVIRQAQSLKVGWTYLILRYRRATTRRNSAWLSLGSWPEVDCKTVVFFFFFFLIFFFPSQNRFGVA